MVVAFRRHTLLPLDDCLYALQALPPDLTRASLHRCLQRHGISRLPDMDGDKPKRRKFKRRPIGFFHIDIAEVRTEEGKLYLFVAIDRTGKFAVAQPVVLAMFVLTEVSSMKASLSKWSAMSATSSRNRNDTTSSKMPLDN